MNNGLLVGKDSFSYDYYNSNYMQFLLNFFVKLQTGNNKDAVKVNGLEHLLNLIDKKINFTLISNHFSLQDTNLPNLYLFNNGLDKNLPRNFGGNNLQFPFLTKNFYFIPAFIDMEKCGMISIERMNKPNPRIIIEQLKERLSELYKDGINTRIFLTEGRPRNEMFKGKKASFIKLIPEIVQNIDNQIYIVPEVISYERIVGDWTFNRQDLMKNPKLLIEWMETKIPAKYFSKLTKKILKNNNIKHLLHNSAVFWDAIALLYNSTEPNTTIHIDYLDPILIKGDEKGNEFYKTIEHKIYDNIRVSATNILSYIIFNHYQNNKGVLKYSETLEKIDELKENLIDKKVPLFHNVQNSSGEEIFENGNRVLREARLIPAFICKGEEIFMNPKSKLLKYYASRFFDYN